jgi:biotin operon repressor
MLTEPKKRILVLCTEARGWSSLLKELGISETRLAAHLRELRREGLLAKDKKGSYIDTDKGLKIVDEAKIVDTFKEEKNAALESTVRKKIRKILIVNGALMDLHATKSVLKIIFTSPYYLFRAFDPVTRDDRLYLEFLTNVYIDSVRSFLEKNENFTEIELLCAWQVEKGERDNRMGIKFDYPAAWQRNLNSRIKKILDDKEIDSKRVYNFLKLISHPITMRGRIRRELWSQMQATS